MPRWKRMPERRDPDLVDLQLEAGLVGVEVGQDQQRHHEGDERRQQAEAAVNRLLLARHQHDQGGAEQGKQRDPGEDAHHCTSTFSLKPSSVPQRGSLTVDADRVAARAIVVVALLGGRALDDRACRRRSRTRTRAAGSARGRCRGGRRPRPRGPVCVTFSLRERQRRLRGEVDQQRDADREHRHVALAVAALHGAREPREHVDERARALDQDLVDDDAVDERGTARARCAGSGG